MKHKLILMLLVLCIAVPAGTAFALSEEEVIDREISTGYYDIWKHSDGTWQVTGRPGGWYSALADAAFRADRLQVWVKIGLSPALKSPATSARMNTRPPGAGGVVIGINILIFIIFTDPKPNIPCNIP